MFFKTNLCLLIVFVAVFVCSFMLWQVRKSADGLLKQASLNDLPEIVALQDITKILRETVALCQAQYIETGFAYALRKLKNTKSSKDTDGKSKKGTEAKNKDASVFKKIISDQHTSMMDKEFGVKATQIHRVLLKEAAKHL